MKLNPDCIRAVMLELEKSWDMDTDDRGNLFMGEITLDQLCSSLPKFDKKDIFYSLYNLEQAGYLDLSILWADGGIAYYCSVNHMTYAGHEFLESIRDSKHWAAVKNGMSAVRNYSLAAISSIAEGVANAAIAAYVKDLGL